MGDTKIKGMMSWDEVVHLLRRGGGEEASGLEVGGGGAGGLTLGLEDQGGQGQGRSGSGGVSIAFIQTISNRLTNMEKEKF